VGRALESDCSGKEGKAVKKMLVIAVMVLSIILVCASTQAVNLPRVAVDVIAEREFFADFKLHPDHSLCEVKNMGEDLIGVVLMCPVGIETTYVFDRATNEIFYENTRVPPKRVREKKRKESILVSDAVRLAKAAAERLETQ
jgi:hypothetical protein